MFFCKEFNAVSTTKEKYLLSSNIKKNLALKAKSNNSDASK